MKRLVALFLIVVAAPAVARIEKEFNVGVAPGYAIMLGGAAGTYGDSPVLTAHVEDEFPSIVNGRGGLELGYHSAHKLEAAPDASVKLLTVLPYVRATRDRWGFEFYSLLGGGYYYTTKASGGDAVSAPARHMLGFNFGTGAERWFGEFGVTADLRYHYLLAPGPDIAFVAPGLRLSYAF